MKVTILQLNIVWSNPQENIRHAEHLIEQEPDSDLYILPEMWSTGFATNPKGIAEDEESSVALHWMRMTAKSRQCAICGSLAIIENGIYRNRLYFINGRNDSVQHYDKHHLFRHGGEDQFFSAGGEQCVVDYEGWRFLLLICYDLRFPIWSRYSDKISYDAIICVANWPESRHNALQILSRARAIENQAVMICCNRVGEDHHSHYRGQSAIISSIGRTLVSCQANIEDAVTCLLDIDEIKQIRRKFNVLADRDLF